MTNGFGGIFEKLGRYFTISRRRITFVVSTLFYYMIEKFIVCENALGFDIFRQSSWYIKIVELVPTLDLEGMVGSSITRM